MYNLIFFISLKSFLIKNLNIQSFCIFKHINKNYERNNHKKQNLLLFDDMANIRNLDPNLLKIDKKSYKNIDIFITLDISQKRF